jgi:hypothetical protein
LEQNSRCMGPGKQVIPQSLDKHAPLQDWSLSGCRMQCWQPAGCGLRHAHALSYAESSAAAGVGHGAPKVLQGVRRSASSQAGERGENGIGTMQDNHLSHRTTTSPARSTRCRSCRRQLPCPRCPGCSSACRQVAANQGAVSQARAAARACCAAAKHAVRPAPHHERGAVAGAAHPAHDHVERRGVAFGDVLRLREGGEAGGRDALRHAGAVGAHVRDGARAAVQARMRSRRAHRTQRSWYAHTSWRATGCPACMPAVSCRGVQCTQHAQRPPKHPPGHVARLAGS